MVENDLPTKFGICLMVSEKTPFTDEWTPTYDGITSSQAQLKI